MMLSLMKIPKSIISDYFLVPAVKMKTFATKLSRVILKNVSNFIYARSQETALIMLIFNALSIYSSHTAQIHGLERSKRENKNFLIEQERKERKIDLFLSVIPPFILKNMLSKRLETGNLTTKSAREKLLNYVKPAVGLQPVDIYKRNPFSLKLTCFKMLSTITDYIDRKNDRLTPWFSDTFIKLKDFNYNLKRKLPDGMPYPRLTTIACRFDDLVRSGRIKPDNKALEKLKNGSAYQELCHQTEGIVILATLAYTILANNIIMPYFKNKLTNKEYERSLAEKGETREDMRRRRRYLFSGSGFNAAADSAFGEFFLPLNHKTNFNKKIQHIKPKDIKPEKPASNTFNSFNTYNGIVYKNSALKI